MSSIVSIENTTLSDIFIESAGQLIELSSELSIEPKLYQSYIEGANGDDAALIADVASGDLVVKVDSTALSADDGQRFLETFDFVGIYWNGALISYSYKRLNIQGAATLVESTPGEVDININDTNDDFKNSIVTWKFIRNGSADDVWLDSAENISSDETPRVSPFNMRLIAVEWSNKNVNVDTDIQIRRALANNAANDSLLYQYLPGNNRRLGTKRVPESSAVDVAIGDKIAIFIGDEGTDPSDMVVTLYWKVLSSPLTDYNENFSTDF